jgi:DNA-binding NarL/FixJ family response regulator
MAPSDRETEARRTFEVTHPLTARHEEIIRFIAEGLTSKQIADRLGISARTVEAHRFNLMRRLRVRNVAELLRVAWTKRLLTKTGVTK